MRLRISGRIYAGSGVAAWATHRRRHDLAVPGDSIRETHLAIHRMLWDLVHALLAEDRGGLMGQPA